MSRQNYVGVEQGFDVDFFSMTVIYADVQEAGTNVPLPFRLASAFKP